MGNKLKEIEAINLFRESIVINGMAGVTFAFDTFLKGGQTAIVVTLAAHNDNFLKAIESYKNYFSAFITYPEKLVLVESVEDIYKAHEENRLGIILGFQTSTPIEQDWTNLWVWYKLGVRIVQLTYMNRNYCGDGCFEETDYGLTYFGKKMIDVMDQVGIVLDLSHCGWKTAYDALRYTKKPVICSHTNPYKLCATPRNFPDELIRGVAETGGVIGINAHPSLCSIHGFEVQPSISDYIDCMEYVIELVGIDHVGLGPDLFEGFAPWQESKWHVGGYLLPGQWRVTIGLENEEKLPFVAVELARRGYDEMAIKKILGLNFLRVFQEVWRNGLCN